MNAFSGGAAPFMLPPPPIQLTAQEKSERAWGVLRKGKDLINVFIQQRKRQRISFDATPEHISRFGISAASLLAIISEEQFIALRNIWLSRHGRFVSATEFLFLLRPMLMATGRFRPDGSAMIGSDEVHAPDMASRQCQQLLTSRDYGLSDLDNYIKELFVAIDRERKEVVSWDAFVNFLIDNAMEDTRFRLRTRGADRQFTQSYVYKGPLFGKTTDEVKDLYSRLYYFPEWQRVVGITKRRCRVIEVGALTPLAQGISVQGRNGQVQKMLEHSGHVMCAEYCDTQKVLLTTCINRTLRAWHGAPNPSGSAVSWKTYSHAKELETPQSFKSLRWAGEYNCLFAGGVNGSLYRCDLDKALGPLTERTGGLVQKNCFDELKAQHNGALTAICPIPNKVLVTAGMDARIFAYHAQRDWAVQEFDARSGHKQGVYCVEHVEGYHFIVTGGFEPHALAWVQNMPRIPAFHLVDHNNPHAASLVGILTFSGTPQVATTDATGLTKIFDIRTFHVLESFNAKHMTSDAPTINCVCYTGHRHRQLVYGCQKLYVFEHESLSSDVPRLAHVPQQPILSCHYLPRERLFMTVAEKEVKLWNADSGVVERCFSQLTTSKITVCAVDVRAPGKVIIGHRCGRVTAHNIASAALLRDYRKHASPITAVALCPEVDIIVVGAADGSITLWTDVDTPLNRGRTVLPQLRRKLLHTFADEVQLRQDPAAVVRDIFAKKAAGEDGKATQAAAKKLLMGVTGKRGHAAFEQELGTVLTQTRTRAKAMFESEASPRGKGMLSSPASPVGGQGIASPLAFPPMAPGAGTTPATEARSRRAPAGTRTRGVLQRRPAGKLQMSCGVRAIAFNSDADLLLLVGERRVATMHRMTADSELGMEWGAKGPPRTHRIVHPAGTELSCGCFIGREAAVVLGDHRGVLWLWSVSHRFPVCVARWYNTGLRVRAPSAPPDKSAQGSSDSDSDEEGNAVRVFQSTAGRRGQCDPVAAELLQSLRDTTPQEASGQGHPVVPTVTCVRWHPLAFLFTSDDLGRMFCWHCADALDAVLQSNSSDAITGMASGLRKTKAEDAGPRGALVRTWTAHDEAVSVFVLQGDPMPCIVTAGMDQRVHIWGLDGLPLGSLRQGPLFDMRWPLPQTIAEVKARVNPLRVYVLWGKLRKAVRAGFFQIDQCPADRSPASDTPPFPPHQSGGTGHLGTTPTTTDPRSPAAPGLSESNPHVRDSGQALEERTAADRSELSQGPPETRRGPASPSPSPKHRARAPVDDPVAEQTARRGEVRRQMVQSAEQVVVAAEMELAAEEAAERNLTQDERLFRSVRGLTRKDRREIVAQELRDELGSRVRTPPRRRYTQFDAMRDLKRENAAVVRRRRESQIQAEMFAVEEACSTRRLGEFSPQRQHSVLSVTSHAPPSGGPLQAGMAPGGAGLRAALAAAPPVGTADEDLRGHQWRSLQGWEVPLVLPGDTSAPPSPTGTAVSAAPSRGAGGAAHGRRSASCPPQGAPAGGGFSGRVRKHGVRLERPTLIVADNGEPGVPKPAAGGSWMPRLAAKHASTAEQAPPPAPAAAQPPAAVPPPQPGPAPKGPPLAVRPALPLSPPPARPPRPSVLRQPRPAAPLGERQASDGLDGASSKPRMWTVASSSDRGSPLVGFVGSFDVPTPMVQSA